MLLDRGADHVGSPTYLGGWGHACPGNFSLCVCFEINPGAF